MLLRWVRFCLWILALALPLFAGRMAQADFQVPPLTGPVVDLAQMIDAGTAERLSAAIMSLRAQTGTQLTVLTVPNLGGLEIEQASIKVTDQWKLGDKKVDRGVLLMVARDEKKVRIEVGQGLEGTLTDADSKRIIDQSMLPLFRSGDTSNAILIGVYQIALKTDPNVDLKSILEDPSGQSMRRGRARHSGGGNPIILVLIILFVLLNFIFRIFGGGRGGRGGPFIGGGGFGGGGFGGGGSGGWGGGGGGFSGGGASGGW